MTKIAPETEAEAEDSDFKPLTAQEAQEWRKRHPAVSVWRLVRMQTVAGVLVALVAWAISGEAPVAWSAGYGALVVVLPAALFARGMARQKRIRKMAWVDCIRRAEGRWRRTTAGRAEHPVLLLNAKALSTCAGFYL